MSRPSNFNTPLRYPGGKAKFLHHIEQIIQHNDLAGGCYAEPYAGGAGVALGLLIKGIVKDIYINDIDPAIYAFWFSVINHNEQLCEMIEETPVTIENWHLQRDVLLNYNNKNIIETAFSTFFLNRTNRSGILKAGVIGGKSQSGKWKLDARFNKHDLIKRIKLINTLKDNIHVSNLDAINFLTEKVKIFPNNTLIYLDPPYYVKGAELYRNFYQHEDHVKIAQTLAEIKLPWIVSYDNVNEIKEIYKSFQMADYCLSYTAQDKKKGSEVIIYNDGLIAPEIRN
ncbi:DNA methyltransferase [Pectobacterium odoriferum]|uniref:site-specific DNA-methyltransferase (adenine-specific) n=1 Tax=Pectobacterium odoriferum TaxID=78398 RepID=A0ABD6VNQ7_9GAMM|nr:DNA adenine methylase [Pectobacterium odoriferum]POD94537.1 DNA methyltransferase [Pectobacterium odoriferum]POE12185.1 DNA methyltransferase [Pectobacterium odoriferum]POE26070.1 DNA methyltransferase [Pectobacterium odoriferum]POE30611.1 DNA methyltransferase [Pectobacterium odoriferum]POE42678.1 DNA methyltransferase [Pectobacterium odoriferum]